MTLSVQGVHRSFGRRPVLHDINIQVPAGARIGLLGTNGSGKTTLLRLLAGTLRPTQGTIQHNGHDTQTPMGRQGMAFVAQDAPVYPELTVLEHVQWWSRVHGYPADAPAFESLLDEAGLHRHAHASAASLSRGQRQRLALCMALAARPSLLLLDEPTTALDADGRTWLIRRLQDTEASLVVATHEEDLIQALGLTAHRLEGGRLL